MLKGIRFILLIICFAAAAAGTVTAQNQQQNESYRYEFRGVSMMDVLDQIARDSGIDLVYDPKLIRNITVYKRLDRPSIQELLTSLLSDYRLDYLTLSSGTIVIVRTPEENPSFGNLSGIVVDAQTGEPLPGATVLLADASGGTSTNHNGHFSIGRMTSGTYHIIISYMGYESAYKTIRIEPNKSWQEKIDLVSKPFDIAPLVVQAHRSMLPSSNSGNIVNPGSDLHASVPVKNPIRSLTLMSGVQYGLPMKDLNLQGSDQGEHRILLDGMPVYNPYSFGKLSSSFSPFALGNITLHKAGYGAERGSQTAGLIELKHDLNNEEYGSALFQADPLSMNLRGDLSVPLSGNRSLNVMSAARTSYWNLYPSPSLETTLNNWDRLDPLITNAVLDLEGDAGLYSPIEHHSDVGFYDIHLAAQYKSDEYSRVDFSMYMGDNRIETGLLNEQNINTDQQRYLYAVDAHEWSNRMIQAGWTRIISPRMDLAIRTGYSENRFDHVNRAGLIDFRPSENFFRVLSGSASFNSDTEDARPLPTRIDGNLIRHFQITADASYSISPSFSLNAGLKNEHVFSDISISDRSSGSANTEQNSLITGSYVTVNHQINRNWRTTYGSRFTWLNTTRSVYAEPRASVQYDQPDSKIGYWSVRFAGGLYRQFINEYRITNTGPTAIVPDIPIWSHTGNTRIPKAWHATGSLLIEPTEQTGITADLFYKWHPVAHFTSYLNPETESTQDRAEVTAYGLTTGMRSFGAGIRLTHSIMNSALRLTAGYDYSFAEIDLNEQFGRTMTTPWNEPHRVQLRTLYRIFPDVTIVAKWQGIWGRSWAFRRSYYNFLRFDENIQSLSSRFDNPDQDRLPVFSQVDLSMIWQPSLQPADIEVRLELINLLNRKNALEKYLMPQYSEGQITGYSEQVRTMPGFYPSVSAQISF